MAPTKLDMRFHGILRRNYTFNLHISPYGGRSCCVTAAKKPLWLIFWESGIPETSKSKDKQKKFRGGH